MFNIHLIFMDSCIIEWISRNNQQDATLVIEFIIPTFAEGSTHFERHTAHRQELQTVFYSLWFTYACGDRPLSSPHSDLTMAGHHMRM